MNLDRATHAKTFRVVLDSENKQVTVKPSIWGVPLVEETAKSVAHGDA